MAEKVLFFTAGPKATTQELAEIAKINQAAQAPFVVGIRNAQAGVSYGYGPEETDYVAGSPPAPYDNTDEEEGTVYPVFDPDAPPTPVNSTQYVLNDGDEFEVTGGTVSVAIEDGEPTFTYTPD